MFKALIKKSIKENFSFYTQNKSKKKSNKGLMIAVYSLLLLSLFASFLGVSDALSILLTDGDYSWLYFLLISIMSLCIAVIGSIFGVYSSVYNARDNEILLSMPIPSWMIIAARLFSTFVIDFVLIFACMLASFLQYAKYVNISFGIVIIWIVNTLCLSLFALAITCLFGFLVAIISKRLKNKNITRLLLTIALIGLYYLFYFNSNNLLSKLVENAINLGISIKSNMYFVYILGDAWIGNILSFSIFIVSAVIVTFVVYYLMSKYFLKLMTYTGVSKKEKFSKGAIESKSLKDALLKREFKHYLSSVGYMLNTSVGIIFAILSSVMLILKRNDIYSIYYELQNLGINYQVLMGALIGFVALFIASMNDITAVSISIEGDRYWILRSLPIDFKDILFAKLKMHLILTYIPISIFILTAGIVLMPGIKDIILGLVFAFSGEFLFAVIGLFLGIKFPFFDWTNETACVKNSAAPMISIFSSLFLIPLFGALYIFGLSYYISPTYYIIIMSLVFVILSRLLLSWIMTKGVKSLEAL